MPGKQHKRYRVRLNDGRHSTSPTTNYHHKSRVLTPKETAAYVSLSTVTLAKLRGSDGGPYYHKLTPGKYGRVGYHISDLDAWLETRKRQSTSEDDFLRGRRR